MKKVKKKLKFLDPSYEISKKVISTLQDEGFVESYLVGGCIRDSLLGIQPKDFDIATSATPNQVRAKIRGTFIIGRRFKLALVKRTPDIQLEVSTFRTLEEATTTDLAPRDNEYGTPEEDVFRRDFTINSLFYNPTTDEILDYTGQGLKDINQGLIKIIGEPALRLTQDPIRILRAVRLAHKINFKIEDSLKTACSKQAQLLESSNISRKREEFLKFLKTPNPHLTWTTCYDLEILKYLVPSLNRLFDDEQKQVSFCQLMIETSKNLFSKSPVYLFANFTACYLEANYGKNLNLISKESLEATSDFLKQELGASNLESERIIKAFKLTACLESFSAELLSRADLPLALAIAEAFHLCPLESTENWWAQLEKSSPQKPRSKAPSFKGKKRYKNHPKKSKK